MYDHMTNKLFNMKRHSPLHARFDPTLDLEKRIELVMSLQRSLGHVNRKKLIEAYGVTQIQAGSLMRDFIHAHAKHLEWDAAHAHYSMKT
jgi:hypothetical protein